MRTAIVPILAAAIAAAALPATPAAAGIPGVELPRLDFPADGGDRDGTVGQGCAAPATLGGSACGQGRG